MKRKKQELSQEEINKQHLESSLNALLTDYHISPNPTRIFKIGDDVRIGNLKNVVIIEDYNNEHLIYKVHYVSVNENYGNPIETEMDGYWAWSEIFPKYDLLYYKTKPICSENDKFNLHYYNSTLDSILHRVYFNGVNFDVDYQRGYVWTLKDKQALIESIMKNIDIGKFTFIVLPYEESVKCGYNLEILDGKQRLSTLVEFYEDRFEYNGLRFSELHYEDKYKITEHNCAYSETRNLSKKERIELFIKLNTTGKVMDKKHIDFVKRLLNEKI